MGAACCCMRGDYEDYFNPSSNVYRNCLCLHCFVENVLNVYGSLFRRGQQHAPLPTTIQGNPATSLDNSLCDMYRSPPRPLPYDTDPQYFQRENQNPNRGKGSSPSNEESETQPLRSNMEVGSAVSLNSGKLNKVTCEEGKKEYSNSNRSSLKLSNEKAAIGFAHIYSSSSEDEDVCPTCLEEYTKENPKIITKCCHHFHLGCIYEWMERSETCPVCGKMMEFDETQ